MRDDSIPDQLRAAIRKRAETPAAERFDDMVRRGVVDKSGRVLIRMPAPPKPGKSHRKGHK